MNRYAESEDLKHSDTEITLGMTSILGIFFGLALVCGVFFGFGYSLGRGNSTRIPIAAQAAPPQSAANPVPDVKTIVEPSSASQQAKPTAGAPIPAPSLAATNNPTPDTIAPSASPQPAQAAAPGQAVPAAYAVPSSAAATAAPANIMVQIAAVGRRDDADVLVTALQNRGYHVSVRTETTDQLLHVQIGPFTTRDQARAMQARLLNDGYNAILK